MHKYKNFTIKNLQIEFYVLLLQAKKPIREKTMRVALIQTDIQWMDTEQNMKNAERMINSCSHTDMFILPEMWNTGFIASHDGLVQDAATEWMKKMSRQKNAALCGSLSVKSPDGKNYNRQYFVRPDMEISVYDKRHLFSYGGEDAYYHAGERRVVAEYLGVRFLLLTCYDLRFPVWSRNANDYDAIICVANWPESRQHVWDTLLRARAIENQCYVIGCNRVGSDPKCTYIGHSAVIDSRGRTVAEAERECEQIIFADLDFDSQNRFRQKFPVLDDRDAFELEQ